MLCTDSKPPLTPQLLLAAYGQGIFPMGDDAGVITWHDPDPRAIFPLEIIIPNARFRRFLRNCDLQCTMDTAFEEVMRNCATVHGATWITEQMVVAYTALHQLGHAHSVEVWRNEVLVGGLYGVQIGSAFFGESMFSLAPNTSKVAFHHLLDRLREQDFLLFDSQYLNDHTASLGAIEIPRSIFKSMLAKAIHGPSSF